MINRYLSRFFDLCIQTYSGVRNRRGPLNKYSPGTFGKNNNCSPLKKQSRFSVIFPPLIWIFTEGRVTRSNQTKLLKEIGLYRMQCYCVVSSERSQLMRTKNNAFCTWLTASVSEEILSLSADLCIHSYCLSRLMQASQRKMIQSSTIGLRLR